MLHAPVHMVHVVLVHAMQRAEKPLLFCLLLDATSPRVGAMLGAVLGALY